MRRLKLARYVVENDLRASLLPRRGWLNNDANVGGVTESKTCRESMKGGVQVPWPRNGNAVVTMDDAGYW
jgi:hypothetical protein